MRLSLLDIAMLKEIDGLHKSYLEFEERARLRSIVRCGVRVTYDEAGVVHVDWSTTKISEKTGCPAK